MVVRNFDCPETGQKCRQEPCKIGRCLIQLDQGLRTELAESREWDKEEIALRAKARNIAKELIQKFPEWDIDALMAHPKVIAEAKRRIEEAKAITAPFLLIKL
jgi:hypothetical protein